MVSMMGNFKMYILLLVNTQTWPPWALPREGSTTMIRFILFLSCPPCLPPSQGQTENEQSRGWQKEAFGKSRADGKKGGAAGK